MYIGDDMPSLLTINRPDNTESITITKTLVQIGSLAFLNENPTFPYTISIPRNLSKTLNAKNEIYMGVYYLGANQEELFRTCKGSLTLNLNPAVIEEKCNEQ